MTDPRIATIQRRITDQVRQLLPESVVVWEVGSDGPSDLIAMVLNVSRQDFQKAKQAIRGSREELEALGVSLLPVVKDPETTLRYYSNEMAAGRLRYILDRFRETLTTPDWVSTQNLVRAGLARHADGTMSDSLAEFSASLQLLDEAPKAPDISPVKPISSRSEMIPVTHGPKDRIWRPQGLAESRGYLAVEPSRADENEALALAA